MKHLYAFLLFAISLTTAKAQLATTPLAPYAICETNTDGFAAFNLEQYVASALSIDPSLYSINFYVDSGLSVIIQNPTAYTNTSQSHQTIYVKVTEIANPSNSVVNSLDLYVENKATPVPQLTLFVCDDSSPSDGLATFDLTLKNVQLTQDCPTCTVTFSELRSDFSTYPITNPNAFQNVENPTLISVEVKTTGGVANCSTFTTFVLRVLPLPDDITLRNLYSCDNSFNLTLVEKQFNLNSNYTLTYFETQEAAFAGTPQIAPNLVTSYVTNSNDESVWVRITANSDLAGAPACFTIKELHLIQYSKLAVTANIVGLTITVIGGGGEVEYSIDGGATFQESNIFTNVLPGTYTIITKDICGNVKTIAVTVTNPPAPTGSNVQVFTDGQTLADLTVNGENIIWYTTATGFTVLPKETLLVDGTTYYAAQIIDNNQSANRLAVTANKALGLDNLQANKLNYYPNPVTDVFTLNNPVNITSVTVYNTLGQAVINQKTNSASVQLNLQTLTSGVYIVKATTGLNTQSFKIIKR